MVSRADGGQIVPWFSCDEWQETAKLIFSDDVADQLRGLQNLRLWKARCETLPTGADATMVLICALEGHKLNANLDDLSQRLALSAALTRFLNQVLTTGPTKTQFSKTMFAKAKNVDIPGWIVKLRHEAAHGQSLPALELLLRAVDFGLDWLRWNYWDVEPVDWVQQSASQAPLAELIDKWEALGACQQAGYKRITSLPAEDLRASNAGIRTVREAISLLEQKILSSSVDNPEHLLSAVLTSQTLLTPPPGLYGKEELPSTLVAQWRPLLGALHAARLLPRLLVKLHERNSRLAALWVLYLLDLIEKLQTAQQELRTAGLVIRETANLADYVQKRGEPLDVTVSDLDPEWWPLVAAPTLKEMKATCVEVAGNPNKNGRIYLDKLLSMAGYENGTKAKINQLWRIYFGEMPGGEGEGDIKTVDDLVKKAPVSRDGDKWIKLEEWNAKAVGVMAWQDSVDLELNYETWE
ncbi:uncharacterized protein LOC135939800 [Cloeon dipterum]|uniref:uncharacterized protein LOC135939800 n=1 Tax=Cloeon dipterum TaxID=197152 RepID=UPI003220341F